MTDHTCLACREIHPGSQSVTLYTGEIVSSYSEAYRHACEAASILAMKTSLDRRNHLQQIEKKRGLDAANALRATVTALWQHRRDEIERERNEIDTIRVAG